MLVHRNAMVQPGPGSILRICAECGRDTSPVEVGAPCPTCGGSTRPVREDGEPGPGRIIGDKYILLRWLGRGGFGAVFAARDPLLEREVAVKVLHVDFESKPDSLQRFYAEARNTSKLQHPHNVKVFDFGHTADGLVYIVMELVHGRPLSRTERPMDPGRAVRLLDQAARALADAHSRGLVHRDLKPDNVMVSKVDGKDFAKVLDYGISKLEDSSIGLTGEGGFVGTPAFTSPEQVRGRPADRRSDIYCFGLLAYDLLAGKPPFTAEDPIAVAMMQIHDDAPPLRAAAPGVSVELANVVTRCLHKDPDRRFADMMAVSAALEHTPEFGLPDVHTRTTAQASSPTATPTVTVQAEGSVSAPQWADVHSDTIAVPSTGRRVLDVTLEPVEDDTEAAPAVPTGSGSASDTDVLPGRLGLPWIAAASAAAVAIGVALALFAGGDARAPSSGDAAPTAAAPVVEAPSAAAAPASDEAHPDGTGEPSVGPPSAAPAVTVGGAPDPAPRWIDEARLGGMSAALAAYRSATGVAVALASAVRTENRTPVRATSSRRGDPHAGREATRDDTDRATQSAGSTADGAGPDEDPRAAIRSLLGTDPEESSGVRDEIRELLDE